jgi:hypothetical protein
MPSNAFNDTLSPLLQDAGELKEIHSKLKTGKVGRQYGLASLNRASVIMSVSAWEGYVEAVTMEAVLATKATSGPHGLWDIAVGNAESLIKRFNTPDSGNVRKLFAAAIGLTDVTANWRWANCSVKKSTSYLDNLLYLRHQIAHGVKPRPSIAEVDATFWREFVEKLGRKTDATVRDYLCSGFGVSVPW